MRTPLSVSVLAVLVVGCGGGGAGADKSPAPVSTTTFGPLQLEGFVNAAPVRASGSGSSIIGLAGDFSSIVYQNPSPKVEQTLFSYGEGNALHNVDFDGGNGRQILDGFAPSMVSYSSGGGTLYFSNIADKTFRSMLVSGGPSAVIGTGEMEFASASPSGGKFAYLRRTAATAFQVRSANIDGTGDTFHSVVSGGSADVMGGLVWLGENRLIWGTRNNLLSLTLNPAINDFITASLPGGTAANLQILAGSRDARTCFIERDGADGRELVKLTFGPTGLLPIGTEAYDINKDVLAMAISPDRRFVVTLEVNEGATPGNVQMIRRNFDMTGPVTIRSLEPDTAATGIGWQPFPTNRVLGGAGSLFGGNASAFLWGNSGNEVAGFAMVRALTPNTAKIDAEGAGGTNLIYAVECDRILKASITVDKNLTLSNLTVTPTTNGLLVNFNAANGEVVNAMPYAVTRGQSKPKVTKVGTDFVIEGAVQGVYGPKGENKAKNGASYVRVGSRGEIKQIR